MEMMIIGSSDTNHLAREVTKYMSYGWTLSGNIFVGKNYCFYQALIKIIPETTE